MQRQATGNRQAQGPSNVIEIMITLKLPPGTRVIQGQPAVNLSRPTTPTHKLTLTPPPMTSVGLSLAPTQPSTSGKQLFTAREAAKQKLKLKALAAKNGWSSRTLSAKEAWVTMRTIGWKAPSQKQGA